jgi:trans-aconitate methyltransferase
MYVPGSVTLCAIVPALIVAAGLLLDGEDGQASVFSEAQAYERFMGRWSRDMAPLLVQFAGVRDGDTVLDVGSGTGALAAAVAQRAPSSRIVGIDPAAPYVALAQSRHGSVRVQFEVGDAQQMRSTVRMFDRTLSLLVVNFIPDVRKALGEMKRVTKPKGIVAAAVWDYGEGMEMLRVFWDGAGGAHTNARCQGRAQHAALPARRTRRTLACAGSAGRRRGGAEDRDALRLIR